MISAPISPLVPLYIAQLLFGVLYAWFIHWVSVNKYWPGGTAWSVVIGNTATLLIQWLFLGDTWSPLETFGSFAFSGTPMIVTYLFRHQQRVLSHKRRQLGNTAMRVRDEVVMDLARMTHEIVDERASVASVVHRLHMAIGVLKSL